jgi:hypothetical protein
MAEYYPLLAKAVAGIPNSTPELRRAVYERARKALLAQLNSLDPPIPEGDIARETESLDSAVERLEAELAGSHAEVPPAKASAEQAPPSPSTERALPVKPAGRITAAPPRPPLRPLGAVAPAARAFTSTKGKAADFKMPPPKTSDAGSAEPRATGAPSAELSTGDAKLFDPNVSAPRSFGGAALDSAQEEAPLTTPASSVSEPHSDLPLAVAGKMPEPRAGAAAARGDEAPVFESFEAMMAADPQRPRSEGPRLYAPQPGSAEEARTSFRLWIVGGVVALVVVVMAVAAWTLRDRPDELAKLKPHTPAQTQKTGKIVERIGGPTPAETGAGAAADAGSAAPGESASAPGEAGAAPANATSTNADTSGGSHPAVAGAASDAAAKPGQTVAVAHRAALLVAAPNEANHVKTYVGTVVWRLDNVSAGAGQPLGTAVHADVDVPDDKMKIALTLQKNTDPSLPVSHTMTIVFTVQSDSPTGGIKQISVPQLREDDTPNGQALIGVPVPIMENSFLIGLSRGDAEKTNLELIKQRGWFDIPILLGDGRIAKLTFEKGTSGTRAIDDAIAAWQTQ